MCVFPKHWGKRRETPVELNLAVSAEFSHTGRGSEVTIIDEELSLAKNHYI